MTLRPFTVHDQDEFIGLVRASAELHYPYMNLPATPEDFQAFMRRYDDPEAAEAHLVYERETGAVAGYVTLNSIIRGRLQSAAIAYAAFAPFGGRGYMSEGLGLVVRHAFENLRLHRLEAQIQPDNTRSIKLVQRAGFRYEGLAPELLFIDGAWRDHERWVLLNTLGKPHPSLPAR
ncbi:GNAT family N-acetyltransferase [Planotetraspora thailandica]|uniref:GNAT family N-acetyltransferase n=1 Tax=Planotetraspora thailandica TaxID=487172 RepID=UPI001EF36D56|nr:GNAT family N-acetyltransferase [Planotetraspora thailandica]